LNRVNLNKSPLIIGHRGASAVAPENTLAAFARALHDGADGIELDVRLSRDGVPFVIHDATIPHQGLQKRFVSRMSSDQLKQVDAGTSFNRHHRRLARPEYTRETIPTLDEVFRLVGSRESNRLMVYVELKCGRSRKRNAALADVTLQSIRQNEMQDRVVVISFNLHAVTKVREIDDSIPTGALFGPRQTAMKTVRQIIAATFACGAEQILLHHRVATKKFILAARDHNLVPVVWTVDDPRWVERASNLGIQALITNCPGEMTAAYQSWERGRPRPH
jgi:glycerophosphoryl diester phosphodiesterase